MDTRLAYFSDCVPDQGSVNEPVKTKPVDQQGIVAVPG